MTNNNAYMKRKKFEKKYGIKKEKQLNIMSMLKTKANNMKKYCQKEQNVENKTKNSEENNAKKNIEVKHQQYN